MPTRAAILSLATCAAAWANASAACCSGAAVGGGHAQFLERGRFGRVAHGVARAQRGKLGGVRQALGLAGGRVRPRLHRRIVGDHALDRLAERAAAIGGERGRHIEFLAVQLAHHVRQFARHGFPAGRGGALQGAVGGHGRGGRCLGGRGQIQAGDQGQHVERGRGGRRRVGSCCCGGIGRRLGVAIGGRLILLMGASRGGRTGLVLMPMALAPAASAGLACSALVMAAPWPGPKHRGFLLALVHLARQGSAELGIAPAAGPLVDCR
ncbi:hypothetical protein LP420_29270 [Massilia sp. B-10]|nr:hypothetical protein LP420_29270 [Massilia sp. B-10]